ncbi:hypothetical protein J2X31_001462 [Flavobacterium arsenatis]|uniref:Fibronectin type-III domain-containing protein n=1 Tax=Flavobacterium arsenatis TaxID=1484332 RepID=A0ABU1TNJ2_9FLAO|nr:DUF6252 family protein [Flavobacterium arsenatis]MDR6967451.1 hypothetical protein [Flavobacterium arsenatis]
MKKNRFLSLCLLLVSTLGFISCSTDVEPLDPAVVLTPPQSSTFFKVDFSGQTFQANTTVAYVSSGNILISGVKSTGQTVSIALDGATVGTYDTDNHIISYNPSPNSEYDYVNFNELPDGNYVSNGSVVITAINTTAKTISGTFKFTGYWSDFTDENPPSPIEFTNGSFTIPYVSQMDNPDCATPTNLTVQRNQNTTSASLNWNAGGTETSWEVVVVEAGQSISDGTSYITTAKPFTLNNLTNQSYDFYVKAICSSDEESGWSNPITLSAVGGGPVVGDGYMNANINGVQYNQMKPFFYPINGGSFAFINELYYGPDALQIQGNSAPLDPQAMSRYEINLVIPRDLWVPGTYVLDHNTNLQSEEPITTCLVSLILPIEGDYIALNEIGTITITEFNFATKRIKGTFSFSYIAASVEDDTEAGPFQVTNGVFDFPFDPEDDIE